MSDTTETITLNILAKDLASGSLGKFVGHLDTIAKKGGLAGSIMQGVGQSFGQMLNPIGLVTHGLGMVSDVLGDSITEFKESQVIGAQTEAVLKSTGDAAGLTADQIGDLSQSISDYSGQDDEAIQKGENLLLTFTGIKDAAGEGNDIFTQTTKIMADMAAAMGTDASGSAIQLGKALQDPIKGISALTRVGVTFTQQQKDQIAAMVKVGDITGAQKVILAELNKEFGGSAKAMGETATGAANKLRNAIGNLEEKIGGPLVDALAVATTAMLELLNPPQGTGNEQIDKLIAANEKLAPAAVTASGDVDVLGDTVASVGGKLGDATNFMLSFGKATLAGHADAAILALTLDKQRVAAGLTTEQMNKLMTSEIRAGKTAEQILADLRTLAGGLHGDGNAAYEAAHAYDAATLALLGYQNQARLGGSEYRDAYRRRYREMHGGGGGAGAALAPVGESAGLHVHFHSAYPPSPSEGQRIAQALAPHIEGAMRGRGTLPAR